MSFSEEPSPFNSANGLPSQSQVTQQQQFPIGSRSSQSNSHSPQQNQQLQPTYSWSAHIPPLGQSPSLFLRDYHALSTTATAAGELFLFGGDVHSSKSASNDLYMISTRDFSATLLKTGGDVPNPRYGHGAVFTSTTLLILGGRVTSKTRMHLKKEDHDDSLYLLNFGTSGLFISRPTPLAADQSFFYSSIAKVDPRRCLWSQAQRSFLSYSDVGRFQALRFRWPAL